MENKKVLIKLKTFSELVSRNFLWNFFSKYDDGELLSNSKEEKMKELAQELMEFLVENSGKEIIVEAIFYDSGTVVFWENDLLLLNEWIDVAYILGDRIELNSKD